MLWENSDGTNLDELLPENVAENAVRWIDTRCMVVDCLTKKMQPDVMLKLMHSGRLDLEATPESKLLKMRKRKLRAAKTTGTDRDMATERPAVLLTRTSPDRYTTDSSRASYHSCTVVSRGARQLKSQTFWR